MSTEEQQAIKNERRRIRDAQRRQNMSEHERRLHNERRRNEYRANQQICEDQRNMPTEEQRVIERERLRLLMETRRQTMTAQERRLQNEHRRNEYRARQQSIANNIQDACPDDSQLEDTHEDQGNMLTEEQHTIERERRRILDANRRQNMTDQEKNLRNERRRNQYRARHHQVETKASSSTSNAPTNLFEHVIHEHVQAEVERLIGRVKTVAINTSKGYMELGPQHRAPLHTSFSKSQLLRCKRMHKLVSVTRECGNAQSLIKGLLIHKYGITHGSFAIIYINIRVTILPLAVSTLG